MNTIVLETKKVSEINGNFFVPAYQRGYRWGKEAIKLLDDISEIDDKRDYRYCLQPIVVKKNENLLELIDGQQRLTTIFLILKKLKNMLILMEQELVLVLVQCLQLKE